MGGEGWAREGESHTQGGGWRGSEGRDGWWEEMGRESSETLFHLLHLYPMGHCSFLIQELMADHNCQDAFWVGTLKNRDLKASGVCGSLVCSM